MTIRPITLADAPAAAQLSAEFGYPTSTETTARRIAWLERRSDHAVFVATLEDVVVGWIDVGIIHHFQSEPYGEIGGFVVSEKHRSTGIGKQLIARAEQWIREQGLRRALRPFADCARSGPSVLSTRRLRPSENLRRFRKRMAWWLKIAAFSVILRWKRVPGEGVRLVS